MNYVFALVFVFFSVLLISAPLIWLTIKLMKKYDVVDLPDNKRRSHKKVTPRAGGLSFIIIFAVFLPICEYYFTGYIKNSVRINQVVMPLSIISFLDDLVEIKILIRFFFHILCSTLAMMWVVHPNTVLHYEIPIYLDLLIGTFALISFLNIYNFLDGIDGITMSQTIHLSLTILLLCILRYDIIPKVDTIINILVIILGWSFVFLYFNWQPAKIFLGDVGSISLGFLLGICLLLVASASAKLFVSCVIAALYYIGDGGLTILIRMMKGEKVWEAHLQHFFQKSVQKGRSHKRVVKRIIKCNFILMLFAVNALYYPVISMIGAILAVSITLIRSII